MGHSLRGDDPFLDPGEAIRLSSDQLLAKVDEFIRSDQDAPRIDRVSLYAMISYQLVQDVHPDVQRFRGRTERETGICHFVDGFHCKFLKKT